ncbi:MAG: peptidase S1 [Lysobacterales bacterium CG17_big_fil_post_rev_8_21_14_2_50_64_11]|nr:MAG: peptidase S1 [Xanthomonadales bacterium CG17_big_fil_post_rev_8_21_14_2_50_64_11]PIX60404.1 MAG: peptidase S1 [Xanthomonadales bacterium CG_4_10_14_3_um_filter_64_11]
MPKPRSASHPAVFLALAALAGVLLALAFAALVPERVLALRQAVGLLPASAPPQAPLAAAGYADAVLRAAPSVVNIYADRVVIEPAPTLIPDTAAPGLSAMSGPPRQRLERSLGSGVIVSRDGYVLTNHHVVVGAGAIQIVLWDGRVTHAAVVGSDQDTDLAVLKLDGENLPALALNPDTPLHVGDVVLAIGNPFGLGQAVSQGIVSALGRSQLHIATFEDFIQTDAAINRGNSGGALVDTLGRLVGINTAVFTQRVPDANGIGFAIPIATAQSVLQQIVREGGVTRGWLGMEYMQGFSPLGIDRRGVVIVGVHPGSPADAAGLRPGDVLLTLDGDALADPIALGQREATMAPGSRVQLQGERAGVPFTLAITLARRPAASAQPPANAPR